MQVYADVHSLDDEDFEQASDRLCRVGRGADVSPARQNRSLTAASSALASVAQTQQLAAEVYTL